MKLNSRVRVIIEVGSSRYVGECSEKATTLLGLARKVGIAISNAMNATREHPTYQTVNGDHLFPVASGHILNTLHDRVAAYVATPNCLTNHHEAEEQIRKDVAQL